MSKSQTHLENIRRARRDLDAAVNIPLRDMDDWRLNVCQDSLEALQAQLKGIEREAASFVAEWQTLDQLSADSEKLKQIRTLLS